MTLNCTHPKIKILYLIGQLDPGGFETQLLTIVSHLDKNLFSTYIINLWSSDSFITDALVKYSELIQLDRKNHSRLQIIIQLLDLIRKIKPDIVHSFGWAGIYFFPLSFLPNMPIHIREIGSILTWRSYFEKVLDEISFKRCKLLLSNSYAALTELEKKIDISSVATRVKYNGLDLDEFDQMYNRDPNIDSLRICAKNNVPVICITANLRPIKRLDVLISAIPYILLKGHSFKIFVIGEGDLKQTLVSQARELGVEDSIEFLGRRNDVQAILKYATIGILTSDSEGLSNAIIEYMAARLPVVATDSGGNRELVINNQTGLLIPTNNPRALSQAIITLLEDPQLRRKFGYYGRRRVEELCSIERMIRETVEIYRTFI